MAESPNGGSTPAGINSKSDGPNQPKQSDCSDSPSPSTRKANTSEANGRVKSCKGCLLYSSRFKDDSRNPLCVGIGRYLPNASDYTANRTAQKSKMEAYEDGKSLIGFRYACVGYSMYNDQKSQNSDDQQIRTKLPFCLGLEVLELRRNNTTGSASVPAHIHNKGDGNGLPQKVPPKPTYATGDEFFSRFTRSEPGGEWSSQEHPKSWESNKAQP